MWAWGGIHVCWEKKAQLEWVKSLLWGRHEAWSVPSSSSHPSIPGCLNRFELNFSTLFYCWFKWGKNCTLDFIFTWNFESKTSLFSASSATLEKMRLHLLFFSVTLVFLGKLLGLRFYLFDIF